MINYDLILNENIKNVLKDILINIRDNGLSNNNHLYITLLTNHKKVKIPKWIIEKYPRELTILIQYEYYDLIVKDNFFVITLSFNDIKTTIEIDYGAVISFADPSANFGMKLNIDEQNENKNKNKIKNDIKKTDNIINFSNFKKN